MTDPDPRARPAPLVAAPVPDPADGAGHDAGPGNGDDGGRLAGTIATKAARRARSRAAGRHNIWFGVGMFGLVGWAVTVPTLAGIAAGVWLDRRLPGGPSWALTGLVAGVLLGSLNAWWWVRRTGITDGAGSAADNGSEGGE